MVLRNTFNWVKLPFVLERSVALSELKAPLIQADFTNLTHPAYVINRVIPKCDPALTSHSKLALSEEGSECFFCFCETLQPDYSTNKISVLLAININKAPLDQMKILSTDLWRWLCQARFRVSTSIASLPVSDHTLNLWFIKSREWKAFSWDPCITWQGWISG